MVEVRKKILWLVSWYPNKYDAFDGDFIQRHARAAALYDDILVLFVKQHELQKVEEIATNTEAGLTERIIYRPRKQGATGRLQNGRAWWQSYTTQITRVIDQYNPHLVHVHIPWKVGLLSLWIKRKYNIDYLVTEHWGIYNSTVADNIYTKNFLVRFLLKTIYSRAKTFLTVSRFLGEGVNQTLVKKAYTIVPNVVDTSLFYPAATKHSRFTFLHVSNMVALKNVEGILSAFHQFISHTGADVQLVLVGNRDEQHSRLAAEMKLLNTSVFFRGEIPYKEVAIEMQAAHVFILNSDMENSPCVIGEALCSGLPVIATRVGGIPELISPQDGILLPPRDVSMLSAALLEAWQQYNKFNPHNIASRATERFSIATVGKEISQHYL